MLKNQHYTNPIAIALVYIFLQPGTLIGQSAPLEVLPKSAQKLLLDFAFIEGGEYTTGIRTGWDSLQVNLPKPVQVGSFLIQRFEVTVKAYREFYEKTARADDKPDVSIWSTEYPASYNKKFFTTYWDTKEKEQYPAICVTWDQAVRYCQWKTATVNALLNDSEYVVEVRLPTEQEWEFAAQGIIPKPKSGVQNARLFPWGGSFFEIEKPYKCNNGLFRAPQGGFILRNYNEDGYTYTAPVKSYAPNEYGLYQMAGNVSEWTMDNFSIDSISIAELLEKHPNDVELQQRLTSAFPLRRYDGYKIVKGGSWTDEPFYCQIGVREIQDPAVPSTTIGFRPICRILRKNKD